MGQGKGPCFFLLLFRPVLKASRAFLFFLSFLIFSHGSVSDNAYFFGFLQQSARWRGVLRLKLIDGRRDYSGTHASNLLALSYFFILAFFFFRFVVGAQCGTAVWQQKQRL